MRIPLWKISDDPNGHEVALVRDATAANLILAAPKLYMAACLIDDWWSPDFPGGPEGSGVHIGGIVEMSDATRRLWRLIREARREAETGRPA